MINDNKMTKEEALGIAKTWNFLKDKNKEALETLVPELQPQESENEKIRKALFDLVKSKEKDGYMVFHNVYIGSMLDWLEKQNERKPVLIIPKFRVGDEIETSNEKSLTITKIDEKGYWSEDLFICDFDEECLWDLVKQKPTNKVEQPKFKGGDWVVNLKDNSIARIVEVKTDYYGTLRYKIEYSNGGISDPMCFFVDEVYRLWTIQDAKEGDVLEFGDHGRLVTGIVSFVNKTTGKVDVSCLLEGDKFKVGVFYNLDTVKPHPATKEQCDLLFQKMREAGYIWDSKKKELIKIRKIENSNSSDIVNEPKLTKEDIDNLNKISKVIYEAGQVQCWYRCERIISAEESDRLCDWLNHFLKNLNLL